MTIIRRNSPAGEMLSLRLAMARLLRLKPRQTRISPTTSAQQNGKPS